MTRLEAHEILDRQKRGFLCLPSEVNQALWVTGDTRGDALVFSEGMDSPLPKEDQGSWQSQGHDVVAGTGRYYGSEEWFRANYGSKTEDE